MQVVSRVVCKEALKLKGCCVGDCAKWCYPRMLRYGIGSGVDSWQLAAHNIRWQHVGNENRGSGAYEVARQAQNPLLAGLLADSS